VIVSTAGHIDHGKTALVRALTGVDTDRLPEEKRRGITIELGFAPLVLDGLGGDVVSIVDVPGHEAFVRTMVAGATGTDLALVVVAADEGVMPQTREHLAILTLLGVSTGVVAITKADLVDADWLELVEEDVRAATAAALPRAPIVPTSTLTGRGIAELRSALAAAARRVGARSEADLFRLPVDRTFVVRGTGTVVTGTVWSGRVMRDETVRVLPSGRQARVRAIQGHGAQLEAALPGTRSAIALHGVDVDAVPRGSTLVTDPAWRTSKLARADVTLVAGAAAWLRPRSWLRFHIGTSEVGARVVTREAKDSGTFSARIVLDEPVVLRAGDPFVLRSSAPLNTVGGGVITDPYAPPRAKPWPRGLGPSERLLRIVEDAARAGTSLADLPVRLGESPESVRALLREADAPILVIGPLVASRQVLRELSHEMVAAAAAYHAEHALDVGIPTQLLRSRLRASLELVDVALAEAVAAGELAISGGSVHLPGRIPELAGRDAKLAEAALERLSSSGAEPPSVEELSAEVGADIGAVLRFMERSGQLVQTEQNRYYTSHNLKLLVDRLRGALSGGVELGPSELREALQLSRKYLIPFLEYSDRVGYTNRNAIGRVWKGT
jgi:selenocysteine-specific elongation factor